MRALRFTLFALSLWSITTAFGQYGTTERVSISSSGEQANGASDHSDITADGNLVVFESQASNLVAGDTNGASDIFLRDRAAETTTRISLTSEGTEGNGASTDPAITPDGRFVVFLSEATNLVAGDTNGKADVFLLDLQTKEVSRIGLGPNGVQGNDFAEGRPDITSDGRFVVFVSRASNLVEPDINGAADVFVWDRSTGETTMAGLSTTGIQALGYSASPGISDDGRYVVFESGGWPVQGTNAWPMIWLRDRVAKTTRRISASVSGKVGNQGSNYCSISRDGRIIAFTSWATNLIDGRSTPRGNVYVVERATGAISVVSVPYVGTFGTGYSYSPTCLSEDGRFVAFTDDSKNLVPNDHWGNDDMFVRDRKLGYTTRVSVSTEGVEAGAMCFSPQMSSGARFVSYTSFDPNLVLGDTNSTKDVFLYSFRDFDFAFAVNRARVAGENSVEGKIVMNGPMPREVVFDVTDNSSLVLVPPKVRLAIGEVEKTFRIRTAPINIDWPVQVTVKNLTLTRTQTITLTALVPSAMEFTPRHGTGGQTISCRVLLNGVTGSGGLQLSILDASSFAVTPPSITVPPGCTEASFDVATSAVTPINTSQ